MSNALHSRAGTEKFDASDSPSLTSGRAEAKLETKQRLEAHPLAAIFPKPSNASFRALVEDIRANGLINSITTYQGKILDGVTRYRACLEAGVAPNLVEFEGDDPLGFVISVNVTRRHMNQSQRALAAAQLYLQQEEHTGEAGLPVGRLAVQCSVGERSVYRALTVLRNASPEIVAEVKAGRLSVSRATKLMKLAKEPTASLDGPVAAPAPVPPSLLTLTPSEHSVMVAQMLAEWNATPVLRNAFNAAPERSKKAFFYEIWRRHPPWAIVVKPKVPVLHARSTDKTLRRIISK